MKGISSGPAKGRRENASGFTLVVTLVAVTMLVVLGVGMLSLSAITLRSADRGGAAQRARANARLALQLALGELQALAGPDARVTAPSSIRGAKGGQQHLTGVWEGWKWNGQGNAPDWKDEKSGKFKGWLISAAKPDLAKKESFADAQPQEESVQLVKSRGGEDEEVHAQVVPVTGSSSPQGGLAWAVFDEAQKADLSLAPDPRADTSDDRVRKLLAAHDLGFDGVKTADWKPLSEAGKKRALLVTTPQSKLAGLKDDQRSFHDVTSGTRGLLTNAAEGGLAKDLSRLFDRDTLPGGYSSRFLYSGKDRPLVVPPTRFNGANPLPSPDPSWALLHSHYRTYTKLSGGAEPKLTANLNSVQPRWTSGKALSEEAVLRNPAFNQQQIAPVIAKAQFVFSLTFGYQEGTLTTMWGNGSARSSPASLRDSYITWLVIDPVITLWNPYNVPLDFTEATIELYRIPMAFRLYKNGTQLAANYTRLSDAHTVEDFKTRQNRFYRLKLQPPTGQSNLVMQPGEHIVFTGHEWTLHGSHNYNLNGLTMRPGFNPPAGAASSLEIGGVTTQNLFVDKNGASSGKDYGKTIRTVAVKGGDQLQVEVQAEHADADNFVESGGKEVTGFLKYYMGIRKTKDEERELIGGIELDYGTKERDYLPSYSRHDLPTIVVNSAIPKGPTAGLDQAEQALRWKEPFLIATFQQKTERDSKFPSRSWVNNAPTNLYSSSGIDEQEDYAHQQFEFKWEPMTDWPPDSPTIEISNERNRGYGASGVYAQTGSEFAVFESIPRGPALSLGEFTHAPLNSGGQLPLTTHIVANSFASPLIDAGKAVTSSSTRTYLDHSYLANNALFDGYFLSSIADQTSGSPSLTAKEELTNFFRDGTRLPNPRFLPYRGSRDAEAVISDLQSAGHEDYERIAANLMVEAPFNVNSTSQAAWEAVLASNFGKDVPLEDGGVDSDKGLPVTRVLPAVRGRAEGGSDDATKWSGHRRLTDEQVSKLAKEIVQEVKDRGPFQSLAEFINRRPGNGDFAQKGAVQAAIDRVGINEEILDSQYAVPATTGANGQAGAGNTADGSPGVISQADLLTPLLPQLSVRGDTFVIRAYGESTDGTGAKTRAWCEATVQRLPEYVSAADKPYALPAAAINTTFGRRFEVTAFRWLRAGEL